LAGASSDTPAHVYYASDLSPSAAWTLVTNEPAYSNGEWTVALPVGTNSSGFYRLQQNNGVPQY